MKYEERKKSNGKTKTTKKNISYVSQWGVGCSFNFFGIECNISKATKRTTTNPFRVSTKPLPKKSFQPGHCWLTYLPIKEKLGRKLHLSCCFKSYIATKNPNCNFLGLLNWKKMRIVSKLISYINLLYCVYCIMFCDYWQHFNLAENNG